MNLKIEYVDRDKIKPYAGNAKKHPAEQIEQIKESIEQFGFNDPIAVWKDGEIIEGHGRLIAAEELGIGKIPVIHLDELTDAQRRAYTLVHNKLTMNSGFDADMLALELGEIETQVDMSEFGFDADDLGIDDGGYYGDERERTDNAYNLDIAEKTAWTDDFWQMPIIHKDDFVPGELIGFNYAKSSKRKDVGIHFYVDDYQFERVWNTPEKYLDVLLLYDCILSPDFSLYKEMPTPMMIWNIYRSRQIGAYYQSKGLRVIPTLSWAGEHTFEFCFRGIEKGSIVSVSTVGVKESAEALQVWRAGMNEAINQLEPSMVLEYGGDIGFDYDGIPVKRYENSVIEKWKRSYA